MQFTQQLFITATIADCAFLVNQSQHAMAPFEQQALAEMVASVGDYSIMTTNGGNEELLFVLDNRNEQLLVYKVDQQKALLMLAREELDNVFSSARSKLGGR